MAQRPHPGDRHRCRRPPPVPLPPRLAGQARRAEVRPRQGRRHPPGQGPRADHRATCGPRGCRSRAPPRPRPACSTSATSGSAATPTPTPTARSGSRPSSAGTCGARASDLVFSFVGKSGIEHSITISDPHVIESLNLMRRRRGGSTRLLAYKGEARWADLDAAAVNAYISADGRRGPHRQGLPHVARHGARRRRARRERREGHDEGLAEARRQGGGRGGGRLPRQHPDDRAKSYIDPRVIDQYEAGVTIAPTLARRHRDDSDAAGRHREGRRRGSSTAPTEGPSSRRAPSRQGARPPGRRWAGRAVSRR